MGSLEILNPLFSCDPRALRFELLLLILGTPSRKLVKGQLRVTHNLKISEKE